VFRRSLVVNTFLQQDFRRGLCSPQGTQRVYLSVAKTLFLCVLWVLSGEKNFRRCELAGLLGSKLVLPQTNF